MRARDILIALDYKHKGDWLAILTDVQKRNYPEELMDNPDVKKLFEDDSIVTLIDQNYPQELKQSWKPPFVIHHS